MLKATVLLVAVPLALAACSTSGHPKEDVAGLSRAFNTLQLGPTTGATWDKTLAAGRQVCKQSRSGFPLAEAVYQDGGHITVFRNYVYYLCPNRIKEETS